MYSNGTLNSGISEESPRLLVGEKLEEPAAFAKQESSDVQARNDGKKVTLVPPPVENALDAATESVLKVQD